MFPSIRRGHPLERLMRPELWSNSEDFLPMAQQPEIERIELGQLENFTPEFSGETETHRFEIPARNEDELREHQRQRNDISAAMPSPSLDASLKEEEAKEVEGRNLDFSGINELSGAYRDHIGAMPEREDQGIGRKLLSILLGYGASLRGGIGHGIETGRNFYDRPYNEKMSDWGIKGEGLTSSIDTELGRLGEEGDFLNESQDNELDFIKFLATRGDKDRDFLAEQEEFDRGIVESDREHDLDVEKAGDLDSYRRELLENYDDRTNLMGDEGVPRTNRDAQNAYERILIQYPELNEVIKRDQKGEYFIPEVAEPEGGGWFGFGDPSEEDASGYSNKKQMRERAYRLLREALGIGTEEESMELDPNILQQLLEQGLLEG